jgi:LCP family protein required for cell wall assembly
VSSSGGKPALISIPRDSYVPIPGHGSNKINAAFAFGGPKLLVHTVEQATDLRVDGYVEIGFAGFASVVDSVGGVDICVKFTMNDKKAGINLKKGCQTLDGKNALGYVRARYSDPRGDIGRAERQRQFLAAIMKKAATPSTVLVPTRYWGFTHSAAHGLVVGDDTSIRDVSRVLLALRAVSNDAGLSLVVPIASTNYQSSAGSAVKWDTQRARSLFSLLRSDQPLTEPPPGTDGKPSGG